MSDRALEQLATRAGIAVDWTDHRGHARRVSPDTLRHLLAALQLPGGSDGEIAHNEATLDRRAIACGPLVTADAGAAVRIGGLGNARAARLVDEDGAPAPVAVTCGDGVATLRAPDRAGYYRLQAGESEQIVAVAPRHCAPLPRAGDTPPWGLVAQLYSLAEPGDMGLASYATLARVAAHAGAHGASALAISPTHAMFSADPGRCSPYAPSSRLFHNVLHVDPIAAFGDDAVGEALAQLQLQRTALHLEAQPLVDWTAAGSLRLSLLRALHTRLLAHDAAADADFRRFVAEGGEALQSHARFELAHARLGGDGWHDWPAELHDAHGSAVRRLAEAHPQELRFHAALQWLARRQLAAAQSAARGAGMAVGLVADLAVGADPGGSHAWSRRHEMLPAISVGAPPDELAPQGQDWRLAAFSPTALHAGGYRAFIELLRATMATAGALRIDHVMGLQRLWLVPEGADSREGAYLHYPLDDLLRLVALESHRHGCAVIGEDLGTVDPSLRDRLAARGVLGLSVLYFERDGADFRAPSQWRPQSVAMTTTHDLPTLAGWWEGHDLALRHSLGLDADGDGAARAHALAEREVQRDALWQAMRASGAAGDRVPPAGPFVDAAIAHVGGAASALALVPLEDLLATPEAPNLPGTTNGHPNWRRRLPSPTAAELDRPDPARRLAVLAAARARAPAG